MSTCDVVAHTNHVRGRVPGTVCAYIIYLDSAVLEGLKYMPRPLSGHPVYCQTRLNEVEQEKAR
jgi:hypothetical protein